MDLYACLPLRYEWPETKSNAYPHTTYNKASQLKIKYIKNRYVKGDLYSSPHHERTKIKVLDSAKITVKVHGRDRFAVFDFVVEVVVYELELFDLVDEVRDR